MQCGVESVRILWDKMTETIELQSCFTDYGAFQCRFMHGLCTSLRQFMSVLPVYVHTHTPSSFLQHCQSYQLADHWQEDQPRVWHSKEHLGSCVPTSDIVVSHHSITQRHTPQICEKSITILSFNSVVLRWHVYFSVCILYIVTCSVSTCM